MKWTIAKRITGVTAVGLAGMLVVGGLSYENTTKLTSTAARVTHTHEMLEATDAILSSLKDAEIAQRGYLITGEPRYLEPYSKAVVSLQRSVSKFRELTTNTAQLQRMAAVDALIAKELEELKQTIDVRTAAERRRREKPCWRTRANGWWIAFARNWTRWRVPRERCWQSGTRRPAIRPRARRCRLSPVRFWRCSSAECWRCF